MGKKVFSDEDIKTIIYEYTNNSIGIESLATKYKVGKLKIRAVLNDNGILIKSKGAQVTIGNSSEIEQSKTQLYESFNEDKQLIAVCKKTGKEYDDVNNLSGSLTRHILDTYGNVPIPTNTYQRKKYELIHKKKWFEEYFDIKEVNKKEIRKCKLCDWETYDLSNNTGSLTKHILEAHNLNEFEYMTKFPESSKFWNNKLFRNNRLNDSNEYVTCLECGEDFIGLSHTHLLSAHNMSFDEYKLKWGDKIDVLLAIRTNGGHRRYLQDDIDKFMKTYVSKNNNDNKDVVATYSRVSSHEQKTKGDLDRQSTRLSEYCAKNKFFVEFIIKDVGSGLNDNRNGLNKLINLVIDKKINKVIIEHKDRLTRFQYNLIEKFFNSYGVQIIHIEKNDISEEEDLVTDIVSLMTSFSGKMYGRRSAKRRKQNK